MAIFLWETSHTNTIVLHQVLWKTSFFSKEDKACEICLNKYATKESFDVHTGGKLTLCI